jgi:hypothetical protein
MRKIEIGNLKIECSKASASARSLLVLFGNCKLKTDNCELPSSFSQVPSSILHFPSLLCELCAASANSALVLLFPLFCFFRNSKLTTENCELPFLPNSFIYTTSTPPSHNSHFFSFLHAREGEGVPLTVNQIRVSVLSERSESKDLSCGASKSMPEVPNDW